MPGTEAITLRGYLVGLGIPALIFAVCAAMTGYVNFAAGVTGASLAVAWFLWDWCWLSRGLRWQIRSAGFAFGLVGAAFIAWIVFRPAPIVIRMMVLNGNYSEGTKVDGILWRPEYTGLSVAVRNDTAMEYTDFDAYVRTDLLMYDSGVQSGGINHCITSPGRPDLIISYGTIDLTAPNGKTITLLLDKDNARPIVTYYRIQCEHIAPHSTFNFAFALAPESKGKRVPPSWAALHVEYDGANRRRLVITTECFIANCADDLEKSLSDKGTCTLEVSSDKLQEIMRNTLQ